MNLEMAYWRLFVATFLVNTGQSLSRRALRKIQGLSLWYSVIGNFILNSFPVFLNSLEKNETAISKIQEQLKKEKG